METMAWDAKKKHGKSLRSGGCAGGSRANADFVPKRTLRTSARCSALAPALALRPGTRLRTLPELVGRLASS